NSQEIRKIIKELKELKVLDEFDDIRKINENFHEVQYVELMNRQEVIMIISRDLLVIKNLVRNIKEYIDGKIDNKKESDNESEKNTIKLITKYLKENLPQYHENKDILSNESKEMIDKTKETLLEARKLLNAVK
ncbi:13071_t:CDS:1, partial [Racocetra fulgida]